MGYIYKQARLAHGSHTLEVNALVDTGATWVVVPKQVWQLLSLNSLGEMEVELADGRRVKVPYAALEIELEGRKAPVFGLMGESREVCIGAEALEGLGLAVDPSSGKIFPTRSFVIRL